MKRIIHHIRKQPEEVRRHILHILTFTAAVVLILLWIYFLGTTLSSPDTQAKMSQDLKPLSALKDNMTGGYNSILEPNLGVSQ
ncbi:MAG: hypothetical protein UU82_C0010G0014 [Candidatus Nomurabacteria bacterium GW2011_GWC2_41_8]|uniref:Uncharacterized protein n=3 Tax=Candidatus Nomuraibacteriota TaxID=1752729 RepID=A0A1F6YD00_9BACT|nr:MAG: hypothetical protein UU58_C0004G0024 [Candidatus Nomurabacteria bacterium GW2011_GWA2_41_25]KKS24166.1 MAG: hypothetical protein UU82_C0010G0014 [Candidatus Nomurabacteria bacterium GW2011_GWC2_41_8]OGI67445.1 MAG: hypothetical protein A2823_00950 [Candidatus Nomurabacteria bacterium RIFCSPHIGHO2_01_FULL_41_91]OGI80544.1 MAG: hypothetical protein A3D43_02885 [Candidatus Nomurabacteria bacterium RIFCSPHIGHO2_02_FULL_41_52]OGI84676.1 MAG: hypothetical protein A3F49_02350 [Candidatus Nomur